MDYSLPIAKRTRSRQADMYKELHKNLKKKRQDNSGAETASKSESSFNRVRLGESENLGSDCHVDSQSVACEEEVDVDALSGDVGDNVSFGGMENSGKEYKGTSQRVINVGSDERLPIVVDGSEDEDEDEVVFLGEECDLRLEEHDDVDVDDEDDVFSGKGSGESVEDLEELASSSEEDNDDPDDEDYGVEKSEISASVEDMESSSEEEEVVYVAKSVVAKGARNKEVGEENNGMENLVHPENRENSEIDEDRNAFANVDQEHDFVAKRTRSNFNSGCAKNKTNLGNLSYPLRIDKEQLEAPVPVENDSDDNENKMHHSVRKAGAKKPILKYSDVQRILVNSILGMEEVGSEGSLSSRNEFDSISEIEESTPPEKTEYEEEMDKLWNELNFSLTCSEIHTTDPPMMENEANPSQEVEDEATRCYQGNHEFVLDDEIGIFCKLCSFVKLEIKYIVAPFFKPGRGSTERSGSTILGQSILDDFNNQDSGFDSQSAWDSYSHEKVTIWDTIPGVKDSMYPHQCEGFEFIWSKIAGGIKLDELKKRTSSDSGTGCIISHAPGTGKSRLTIVFLQSYMNLYPDCKPVIVAPRSMLLTWEEEFKKWKFDIPFHNLNKPELSGSEDVYAVSLINGAKVRNWERKDKLIRNVKLYSWHNKTSILGISYQLFARLVGTDKKRGKLYKEVDGDIRKILIDLPGIFVFDEGHTPRNHESGIFKALSKIKTEKRIILSGTPFQNNFEELFNILSLVAPKFADSIQSRNQRVVNKRGRKTSEAKGNWASLTSSIGKVSDDRCEMEDKNLKQLKTMIAPIVHIHKGTVLKESLPGLKHSVVVLQPDDFQKSLLEGVRRSFLDKKGSFQRSKSMLCLDHVVSVTSVHPSLLPEQSYEEFLVHKDKLERLRLNPEAGVKTKFLMLLLKLSASMNEKVLVFSQYIEPLILIMDQLKSCFNWIQGNEVLYMDGKRDVRERQTSIKVFNDPKSEAKVLLASTRACGEGINLVGASRVLLLDVTWNPAVERQAISRAYRLGQQKFVYVYHLITSGTMEEKKCCRQAKKDRYSKLVFSSSDGGVSQQKPEELKDKILEEMVQHHKLIEEIIDQPEESKLIETFGMMDLQQ